MIKANELRSMTVDEVKNKLESLRKDLYNLRSEAESGRIEKPHKIAEARKNIARCQTILREKSNVR